MDEIASRTGPATTVGAHQHLVPFVLVGTVDPSTGAGVAAPIGALYLRNASGAGQLWLKVGASDTSWTRVNVP